MMCIRMLKYCTCCLVSQLFNRLKY
jgi:hypothetical protein